MADLSDPDFGTVYYRSKDPLKNFKIKVIIKRATTDSLLSGQFGTHHGAKSGTEVPMEDKKSPDDFKETFIFKWQEKIFNKAEFEKYSTPTQSVDPLERRYAKLLEEKLPIWGGLRPTKRLFTYVNQDSYEEPGKVFLVGTSEPKESPLADIAEQLHTRRRAGDHAREDPFGARGIPRLNIVEDKPSAEHKRKHHFLWERAEHMYLVADLGPIPEDTGADFQAPKGAQAPATDGDAGTQALTDPAFADPATRYKLLCKISIDARGTIAMRPDFTKGPGFYKLQSPFSAQDLYEYRIENASSDITKQEHAREVAMHTQPPPGVLRVMVYGEIISASNFDNDDLYVRFNVEIPQNWFAFPNQPLTGATVTCSYGCSTWDDQAYFSYPFELQMFYKSPQYTEQSEVLERLSWCVETSARWPVLFFEVNSVDSWSRHRTEGYAYTVLPSRPGAHELELPCWRPVGSSIACELRRFYIGGSPELEDPTYPYIPNSFDGHVLSKYGFRTESNGVLRVRLQVVHQSQNYVEVQEEERKLTTLRGQLAYELCDFEHVSV